MPRRSKPISPQVTATAGKYGTVAQSFPVPSTRIATGWRELHVPLFDFQPVQKWGLRGDHFGAREGEIEPRHTINFGDHEHFF